MLCRDHSERGQLAAHLHACGIESRPIVAGNMARQPLAAHLDPADFPVADEVFRRGLWVSVHPGLAEGDLERIAAALTAFWA
jgi:CDP-6-deoxy-D-xylo-4-hexulose-3-dehydrase